MVVKNSNSCLVTEQTNSSLIEPGVEETANWITSAQVKRNTSQRKRQTDSKSNTNSKQNAIHGGATGSHILRQQRALPSLQDSSRSTQLYRFEKLNLPKVCRVCFFVNGDRHFRGLPFVVNLDRIRTLDLLCSELSRILVSVKTLPSGVRIIFNGEDGSKLESVQELRHNEHYVCSSTEHFIRLQYTRLRQDPHLDSCDKPFGGSGSFAYTNRDSLNVFNHSTSPCFNKSTLVNCNLTQHPNKRTLIMNNKKRITPSSTPSNSSLITLSTTTMSPSLCSSNAALRPKIVALLRGSCRAVPSLRPSRRAFRFLLNHRIAQNYEQLLNEISKCVKLNVGAVHCIYGLTSAKKITCLADLSDDECVYLVYGRAEKSSSFDFFLDDDEYRDIVSIVGSSYSFPSVVEERLVKTNRLRKSNCLNRHSDYNRIAKTPVEASANKRRTQLPDKELKAFSLPRNFHVLNKRTNGHNSLSACSLEEEEDKENLSAKFSMATTTSTSSTINSTPNSVTNSYKRKNKLAALKLKNPNEKMDNYLSYFTPNNSKDTGKHISSYSNLDSFMPGKSAESVGNRADFNSNVSNSLVFDNNSYYCQTGKFDYTCSGGGNYRAPEQQSASGSSTPGAASVSCSDDFSYASVDVSSVHSGFSNSGQSYANYSKDFAAVYDDDDNDADNDDDSSSDSSTPSFSSLSCVARYPESSNSATQSKHTCSVSTTSIQSPRPSHYNLQPEEYSLPNISSYCDSAQTCLDSESTKCAILQVSVDSASAQQYKANSFQPKKEVNKVYFVGDSIGDGKFGVVYTCVHRITGQNFALKVVDKIAMQQMLPASEENASSGANSEAAILRRVQHPNIVRLYDHFDYVDQTYLVLELLKGGDLFDAISIATKYSEPEAAEMVNDLLKALSYLHRHRIVHRDIKLENLMVAFVPIATGSRLTSSNGTSGGVSNDIPRRYRQMIKLADFGLAVEVRPNEQLFTVCGTPTYVAPEILVEIGYSFPVDIWAAGVISYILLCGFPPFANEENDQHQLFDQIIAGKFDFVGQQWANISDSAKQLIKAMLCVDQTKRLTAAQVIKHEWLVHYLNGQ